jgi:hypothetical protein
VTAALRLLAHSVLFATILTFGNIGHDAAAIYGLWSWQAFVPIVIAAAVFGWNRDLAIYWYKQDRRL